MSYMTPKTYHKFRWIRWAAGACDPDERTWWQWQKVTFAQDLFPVWWACLGRFKKRPDFNDPHNELICWAEAQGFVEFTTAEKELRRAIMNELHDLEAEAIVDQRFEMYDS